MKIENRKLMIVTLMVLCCQTILPAMIDGVTGTAFNLTVREDYISTPDGGSWYMWGYALNNQRMQYPGPTLIVNQGDTVTVTLQNGLVSPYNTMPVSIVFPGQSGVTSAGGSAGLLTREALPGQTVTYTFTASQPGTYVYHSGTRPDLQIEMGMVGAIIVRPAGSGHMMSTAYESMDSMYDHEYLFLTTEIDPIVHQQVEVGDIDAVDMAKWFPVYWFINGRCAPDTMDAPNIAWLPTQPYNCMPMMHPGDRLLGRYIQAGRDPHPFHTHGNNFTVIARDGRLLKSQGGMGADLAYSNFTLFVPPGGTSDFIFEWTGKALGWDIYGHAPGDPMEPHEYAPDHGKPFPVALPPQQFLTNGAMWSGSPFLGTMGSLPPGEGGLNPNSGYSYMWHSHNEKEMTNYDIFPGGLMTMLMIEPPSAPIQH